MNGLWYCIRAQGIALFNTPVSHSGDQYTIRPWLYPHLINLSIRIDWVCHGVQSQTDKLHSLWKWNMFLHKCGGFWHHSRLCKCARVGCALSLQKPGSQGECFHSRLLVSTPCFLLKKTAIQKKKTWQKSDKVHLKIKFKPFTFLKGKL